MENLVHCLIDRSGSMRFMKDDLIKGYNAYLYNLSDVHVALTMFDSTQVETIHDFLPVTGALRLNNENYQPGANTPLFDAMAHVMRMTEAAEQEAAKTAKQQPQVLIVVYTDGQENASSEYTLEGLNEYIKKMEDERHWTFLYLGAAPEAWGQGGQLLQGTQSAQNSYNSAGGQGTASAYNAASVSTAGWAQRQGPDRILVAQMTTPDLVNQVLKDSGLEPKAKKARKSKK